MDYRIIIDEKKLSDILFSVSSYCKGKLRFYSNTAHNYTNRDKTNTPFCRILSRTPASNALCTKCNEAANKKCQKRSTPYAYYCHTNLLEIAYPIFFDGIYIGNLSIGQFRVKSKTIDESYLSHLARLSKSSTEKLQKAWHSQPLLTEAGIEGAKMILEMTAKRLFEEQVFSIDFQNVIVQIEQYIRENLNKSLTLNNIAGHVYMNPSYLSSMYHKATGETLSHFIQKERIARSIYLFSISAMSVAEVSAAVGFRDPNYFTKVFRKETGHAPRTFRQKLVNGEIIY